MRPEDAHGERRQLTVLFCDIVGSTQLAQSLDLEDLRELVAEYQKICGDAVLTHGGHIAQYLGDGVVVYFGYPRAHEDEAQRAVRCGLDILARVRALRDSGRIPSEIPLDVRLGAHTGRVLVGPVGAGDRRDRLALGDTPNLAARIQSLAEPGTFIVSGATWKIVEGYFSGKGLGEMVLKGMAKPVPLWLVTGESELRERVEVASELTPFVGRQRELSVLDEAWKESQSGRSTFVLLRGEPGVGKSRLIQFFRDEIQFEATDLLGLRPAPYSRNSPFHPLLELIERRFHLAHVCTPAERLDTLEEGLRGLTLRDPDAVVLLASLLSIPTDGRYAPLNLSPARRRSHTLQVLVELVTGLASAGPTLLLVEDLHWMDTSTLEFLDLLVRTPAPVPLLGLFTARPDAELAWSTASCLRTIELPPFERTEAETLVRYLAFGKALPTDVLGQIVARSDGVPLFVEELTRSVLDSGMLRERDASWELVGPLPAAVIPATMDASLTSRIDALGPSRATAQLAATIGREFSFALLRAVSERDQRTLREDLQSLVDAGLVSSADDDEIFVFTHALVRDAAYNSLLRSTRQSNHARVAAALRERFSPAASVRPDLVAHHLTCAGQEEEAVALWEAAGQQALARTATHEAAGHFRRAIDCLRRLATTAERQERELELQILLAPLLMAVHGWGAIEVEQTCQRALGLAQGLQRSDRTYPPLWGLWTVRFLRGAMVPALEAAELALQTSRASGIRMLEVTGHEAMSYSLVYQGKFDQALEEAEAGLALFDFEQEKSLVSLFGLSPTVGVSASRGHSLWMLGSVVDAEKQWDAMVELARDVKHRPSLATALGPALHGWGLCFFTGQMDRIADIADELIALAKEEDFFLWYAVATMYRGLIALARGERRAQAQVREGMELFTQTGARLTLVMMNVLWAEALYWLGDDEEAFRRLTIAEEEMNTRREALLAPDIWRVRGRLLAHRGDRRAAEECYRHALARAAAQHALSLELRAALDLHELLAEDGRAEEGRAQLARLLKRFTQGLDRPEPARAAAILAGALDTAPASDGGGEGTRRPLSR